MTAPTPPAPAPTPTPPVPATPVAPAPPTEPAGPCTHPRDRRSRRSHDSRSGWTRIAWACRCGFEQPVDAQDPIPALPCTLAAWCPTCLQSWTVECRDPLDCELLSALVRVHLVDVHGLAGYLGEMRSWNP